MPDRASGADESVRPNFLARFIPIFWRGGLYSASPTF